MMTLTRNRSKLIKLIWVASTLLVLLIAFFVTISNNRKNIEQRRQRIMSSPSFTSGFIEDLEHGKGKTTTGVYKFEVEGVVLTGKIGDGRLDKIRRMLFERSFPVIYNSKDPEINAILIFPSDFAWLNIPFPDSLNWVKEAVE